MKLSTSIVALVAAPRLALAIHHVIGHHEWMGCYKDDNDDRALPTQVATSFGGNNYGCSDKCLEAGFAISGNQFGGQCFCGNNDGFKKHGGNLGAECDMNCPQLEPGGVQSVCGAAARNSIFRAQSPTYVGCYVDSGSARVFTVNQFHGNIAGCSAQCKKAGFDYSGNEYTYECACGTKAQVGNAEKRPDGECDMDCKFDEPGAARAKCGGSNRLSIYTRVAPTPSPSSSPSSSPSGGPSSTPSGSPSAGPSSSPSAGPTKAPTPAPVTSTPTSAPVLAGANGDPHFATWGGDKYDFHGGCDLVLLKNPNFAKGLGLDIHIRTKIHTWWSFIEMAVVRIGSDVLEVKGGDTNGGSYWINGQLGQDLNDGTLLSLSGFPVKFRLTSAKQNKFRVDLGNGDALSIETYKNFVRVNVKANPNHDQFQGSSGLMGSFPHGVKLARDQTTALEDVNFFGKEWQVLMTETVLFHSSEGVVQHPQECAMPNETEKANKRRRLGESLLTQQDAETACSHVHDAERDACVFDVLATNDKDMAGSY